MDPGGDGPEGLGRRRQEQPDCGRNGRNSGGCVVGGGQQRPDSFGYRQLLVAYSFHNLSKNITGLFRSRKTFKKCEKQLSKIYGMR
jgi:hypothetical protein